MEETTFLTSLVVTRNGLQIPCPDGFTTVFFFFSSRRRHTRYWRDWSSDVCSSDLGLEGLSKEPVPGTVVVKSAAGRLHLHREHVGRIESRSDREQVIETAQKQSRRSEERRVGKEGRSRWSPYH